MKIEKFGDINQKAFDNDQAIKSLKTDLNVRWLKMAELLFENRKRRYFEVLGYDTFEAYIAQEELGFKRTSVFRIIRIYKSLILDRKVPHVELADIDSQKLDMILPELPTGNLDELLSKARSLSRSDLKAELSEPCTHEWETIVRCSQCHKIKGDFDEN